MRLSSAADVPASQIRAIAALADEHPGTLRLFVGEDTRPTPGFIQQAAVRAIEENRTYYTPNAGYVEVREAICQHLHQLHGVSIDPRREIVFTTSGMNAILLAIQATLGAGTSALVITPLWPNMTAAVGVSGATAIEVPLSLDAAGFQLDWSRLERAVRPDTRVILLASPGNPTGWTASPADWERLADFCERHGLWLLADSVYERIVFQGRAAPSPFAVERLRSRLINVNSFSKAYRMTGWRAGYVIGPPQLGKVMTQLQEFVVSNAPGIVQMAARAAVLEGELEIAESQRRYAEHLDLILAALGDDPDLELPRPPGGFYVFPRLRGLTDSFGFCQELVRSHGLGLAPGSAFGSGGDGHIRICFAVERPILEDAIERFRQHWRSVRDTVQKG